MASSFLRSAEPASPSTDRPPGVIARDTFVQVLTEVHLIEAALKQRLFRNDDGQKRALSHYAELYDRWGIDEERFKTTYTWWYQRPIEMDALLEEVAENLTELERQHRSGKRLGNP